MLWLGAPLDAITTSFKAEDGRQIPGNAMIWDSLLRKPID